jgi:hypothetical protein
MIAANKRLIKANLSQGVVGIQGNLISLYQANLNAVSVTSALIAGFAFTAVSNPPISNPSISQQVLAYFYYSLFTMSFVTALWALSQATISTMFGPSLGMLPNDMSCVICPAALTLTVSLLSVEGRIGGLCQSGVRSHAHPAGVCVHHRYRCHYYTLHG